jgi:hypothetical protein
MSKRKVSGQKVTASGGAASENRARSLLVAVELGGEWPAGFETAGATVRRVLSQEEGESPALFAGRVADEVENAAARGAMLSLAAIACNERADEAALDARRRMARTLLGTMAGFKTGSVYLTASARTSGRLRHALSSLAAELGEEWSSAGVETSVRFGDESRSAPRNGLEHLTARVA